MTEHPEVCCGLVDLNHPLPQSARRGHAWGISQRAVVDMPRLSSLWCPGLSSLPVNRVEVMYGYVKYFDIMHGGHGDNHKQTAAAVANLSRAWMMHGLDTESAE